MKPKNWHVVPLGELCDVASGGTPSRAKASYFGGDVSWVKIGDMLQDPVVSTEECISADGLSASSAKVLPAGTLLLSIFATIGRTAVLAIPAATNQAIAAITPRNNERLTVSFLRRFLDHSVGGLQSQGRGVAQANINLSILRRLPVPVPPIEEQRRIAAILDKADELRAKRRATLAHLDSLTQSIFVDMFADPRSILNEWPTRPLGALLDFLTSGSRGWAKNYSDTGSLFLRIQNVGDARLLLDDVARVQVPNAAEARRTRVEPGDVLLSITADLGRTAVIPAEFGDAYINQHLAILRTSAVDPVFLAHYLRSSTGSRQLLRLNREGVKAGLNFDDIRSVLVPLPPVSTQMAFSQAVGKTSGLRSQSTASATELQGFLASLQQRAFSGAL